MGRYPPAAAFLAVAMLVGAAACGADDEPVSGTSGEPGDPFGDMPAVEGLSHEDIEAVIAFIRAEQERQGFEQ